MSKDGNANALDTDNNQEDIRRLENYEQRSKINSFETLKNEDILNYIKNIEENFRLEVNSGDEDYAGTKRSSNCSVRCSRTRFRSSRKGRSGVTSVKNRNAISAEKKTKRSSGRKKNASNYCCSSRKLRFRSNPELTIQENSTRDLDAYPKSAYQYPNSSDRRDLRKYRECPPRFHGWYSRDRKAWPAVTETTSLEIAKIRSQHATLDSGVNGRFAEARTFKPLRRRKLDNSIYLYPDSSLKTKERNPHHRVHEWKEDPRMNENSLKKRSDVSGFMNQRPFDKLYPGEEGVDKSSAHSYQMPSHKEYKELISAYRYSASGARQLTLRSPRLRSNRLTARPPDARSSLSRGRISQWDNETMGPALKASSPVTRAPPIDESYRRPRKSRHKNNTNQRRREPASVLGERGPSCCRRLLTGSQRLCEAIRARKGKRILGCCCEGAECCATCCHCPENANDPTCDCWARCEVAYRPLGTSERTNHTKGKVALCDTFFKPPENISKKSDFDLSTGENARFKATRDYRTFDKSDAFDDVRTKDCNDKIELEDSEPQFSFSDDWTWCQGRRLNELARERERASNDLKKETRRALRQKITGRYPPGERSSIGIRTDKLAPGDFARYDVAKPTCECRELFHDPPAACLIGSCSCIGSNNRAEANDSDSSKRISVACCCCLSTSSCDDEEDPVKKLETFCEKVKAVNQDALETSKSTCCNAARINARQYFRDERDPSKTSVQVKGQAAGSVKREWLTDPTRLRIGKPKNSGGGTILIYPPRGENGPPLTLYKKSSNVNCRVKSDGNAGFRYSVTYVQKFVSPTWLPSLAPEIPLRETDADCDCSTDHG